MPLLDDIADFIENNVSLGTYTVYKGYTPPSPNEVVVLFERSGEAPETTMGVDYPSFQVTIRGLKHGYQSAQSLATTLQRALHKAEIVDLDVSPATTYVYCHSSTSGVLPIGHDLDDRPQFSLNFDLMRTF